MLQLKINGKDMSHEDINLLICNDPAKGILELMFFTDEGEVKADSSKMEISGNIDIRFES